MILRIDLLQTELPPPSDPDPVGADSQNANDPPALPAFLDALRERERRHSDSARRIA